MSDYGMWYVLYEQNDGTIKVLDMFRYSKDVGNSQRRRLVCQALGLDESQCSSHTKEQFTPDKQYV